MNKVILMGRLVADPTVTLNQNTSTTIARYRLAVDRRDKDGNTDFINCITFNKGAEFAEKYLNKGTKIVVVGRIQTSNYINKDGQKVYSTDVVVDEHEFAESKAAGSVPQVASQPADEFMNMDVTDEGLPFN